MASKPTNPNPTQEPIFSVPKAWIPEDLPPDCMFSMSKTSGVGGDNPNLTLSFHETILAGLLAMSPGDLSAAADMTGVPAPTMFLRLCLHAAPFAPRTSPAMSRKFLMAVLDMCGEAAILPMMTDTFPPDEVLKCYAVNMVHLLVSHVSSEGPTTTPTLPNAPLCASRLLRLAVQNRNEELTRALLKGAACLFKNNPDVPDLLRHMCRYRMDPEANKLLDLAEPTLPRGALATADDKGSTVLTLACWHVMEALALRLVKDFRADCGVGHADAEGDTPLTLACWKGMDKVVRALCDASDEGHDVRPSHAEDSGYTALMLAAMFGRRDMAVHLMTRFGKALNPGAVATDGCTALIAACRDGLFGIALDLLGHFGSDTRPGHVDGEGKTALMWVEENVCARASPGPDSEHGKELAGWLRLLGGG